MNHNSTLNTKLSSVKIDAYSINQDKISLTENYVYKKPEKKQMKLSFIKLGDVEREVDELILVDQRKLQKNIVYETSGYNPSGFTPDRKRLGASTQTNRLSTPFTYDDSSSNVSRFSGSRSMSLDSIYSPRSPPLSSSSSFLDFTSNSPRSSISIEPPSSSSSSSNMSIDKNFNLFGQSNLIRQNLKRAPSSPLLNIAKRTKLTVEQKIDKGKKPQLTIEQKIEKLENDDFLKREGLFTLSKKKKPTSPKASGSKDYDSNMSRIENLQKKKID